jgi:sRNA-binding regulator protein Hfq
MRKLSSLLLISLVLVATAAKADTIHLKNGSILKGKVASFADDQFVVMLDTGSGRYMSRAMVYIGDVARIEFDSVPGGAPDSTARETNTAARPADPEPRVTSPSEQPRNNQPIETQRNTQPPDPQPRDASPRETSPREANPTDTQPASVREPEAPPPDKPTVSTAPAPGSSDNERASRKSSGLAKATYVDVVGKRDWTSTGLIINRGDRIRITATGSVILDPASGRMAGPEGASEIADPKKLMPDQPTGALIGVIGADNDDFIFIGRSAEFTATRGGLLFLSVNEGTLADNTGTFKAAIEVQKK